tara:strand:- start:595 stop:1755 length:1161 start_codon:yes stop_codon:yes gene_type:complete
MSGEQQNIYEFITDPVDEKLYPVKSKKGARVLKNYISIYREGSNTDKTILPNPEYSTLHLKQRMGNFTTYSTQRNTLNMNGEYSNDAYSHAIEHSNNLGHWVNSSSTRLKVLVLCASKSSFDNRRSINWLNLINPHIAAEFITRNLPFEVTWLGESINNGTVYDTAGNKSTEPCDMDNMTVGCIKHTLIKSSIPTPQGNRAIRARGNKVSGKIDVLGNNKYDIIIDEFCPKTEDVSVEFNSIIPHMYKNSWIISTKDLSNGEGTWARAHRVTGISTNLIRETTKIEIPPSKKPMEVVQILKSMELVKAELKRAGIYEFTRQKVFNNSKLGDANHLVHRLVHDQYPYDSIEDKLHKTEVILFNARNAPYNKLLKELYIHKLIPDLFE